MCTATWPGRIDIRGTFDTRVDPQCSFITRCVPRLAESQRWRALVPDGPLSTCQLHDIPPMRGEEWLAWLGPRSSGADARGGRFCGWAGGSSGAAGTGPCAASNGTGGCGGGADWEEAGQRGSEVGN